jgi:hypothetical protein
VYNENDKFAFAVIPGRKKMPAVMNYCKNSKSLTGRSTLVWNLFKGYEWSRYLAAIDLVV